MRGDQTVCRICKLLKINHIISHISISPPQNTPHPFEYTYLMIVATF